MKREKKNVLLLFYITGNRQQPNHMPRVTDCVKHLFRLHNMNFKLHCAPCMCVRIGSKFLLFCFFFFFLILFQWIWRCVLKMEYSDLQMSSEGQRSVEEYMEILFWGFSASTHFISCEIFRLQKFSLSLLAGGSLKSRRCVHMRSRFLKMRNISHSLRILYAR